MDDFVRCPQCDDDLPGEDWERHLSTHGYFKRPDAAPPKEDDPVDVVAMRAARERQYGIRTPEVEPVAWRVQAYNHSGKPTYCMYFDDKPDISRYVNDPKLTPLYASPPQVSEEMVERAYDFAWDRLAPNTHDERMKLPSDARSFMRDLLRAALQKGEG